MQKTIWYISKYITPYPRASGGNRGFYLVREFAQLGYRSVIITSDSNPLSLVKAVKQPYVFECVDGIQLWWVRTLKYRVAKSLRRILSWLDFEWRLWRMPKTSLPKPDVMIVSSLSLLTVLNGFWLKRKYKCRLVFEVRDIWPLTIVEEGGFSPKNPFVIGLAWIEKLGYRYADVIVGTMPNLGEHVRNVLRYVKPVSCIPMGISESSLGEQKQVSVEYLAQNIPPDKFIIAHAGTIGITNALDAFFECAQSLVDKKHLHFLILGDGDLRAHYQKTYGHLKNLTFAPKVEKQMVQSVLVKCNLLYFSVHDSAVWCYGQSLNKVIDYMLSGKPVLASYTGYSSMINEAGCGVYVPAGNIGALRSEILRLSLLPASELEEMGARGRSWLLVNRNYRKLAEDYLRILFPEHEEVCGEVGKLGARFQPVT